MNGAKGYGLKTQPPVWFTLQLELSGYAERIDCRSYEERGIDKVPQQHLGPAAHAMQERGITLDILRPDPEVEQQKWELKERRGEARKELVWVKAELVEDAKRLGSRRRLSSPKKESKNGKRVRPRRSGYGKSKGESTHEPTGKK